MKKLLALAIVMAAAIGCTDDDLPNGPNLQPSGQFIVGFPEAATSYSYFADEGQVQREFPVILIGGNGGNPSDQPLVVNYEIVPFDPATGEGSTATEGVEYNLANTTGQITIPAGADFVNFPILVNTCCLDADVATSVVIKLTSVSGGDDSIISENNSTFTVNFVGCQADLAGTYTVVVVRESNNASTTQTNQSITQVDINEFKTQNTGTFTPGQAPDQGFFFNVLCGEITVPSQGLFAGLYSNEVVGVPMDSGDYAGFEGHVLDENTFKIRYKANAGGATGYITWTSTYTRNN